MKFVFRLAASLVAASVLAACSGVAPGVVPSVPVTSDAVHIVRTTEGFKVVDAVGRTVIEETFGADGLRLRSDVLALRRTPITMSDLDSAAIDIGAGITLHQQGPDKISWTTAANISSGSVEKSGSALIVNSPRFGMSNATIQLPPLSSGSGRHTLSCSSARWNLVAASAALAAACLSPELGPAAVAGFIAAEAWVISASEDVDKECK